jgi:glycine cleavage system T protein
VSPEYRYSYGRQNWFEYSANEHAAVRERVGLFDQSSFAKFAVVGADAEAALNQICAADVAVPVGKIVYTQWLNERGGIEADLTVTREAEDRYLVVTACANQTRDFHWLRTHIPPEARAWALDVSSAYVVLGVMGPNSRRLLSDLTDADLTNEAFPFGSSRVIDLAYARVRASRITYVGELGWELYIPSELAQSVYDEIVRAGAQHGLSHVGYHAMNSLRMEKAYRHWGHDITDEDTPMEAGLGFAVAWSKPHGFIGRAALQRQKEQGVRRRLVNFRLSQSEPLVYHNEPIWRDGRIVGRITSGMFGHTTGRALALGYVANSEGIASPEWVKSGRYELEIAAARFPAEASLQPFYDPSGQRIKA